MKTEKPIRVIPNKGRKHKTELRVFAREIHESFCVQPGCKFKGRRSVQGVCHSDEPMASGRGVSKLDWKYIDAISAYARHAAKEELALMDLNIRRGGKKPTPRLRFNYLVRALEGAWMQSTFGLDELVRLRGQNALLKHEVERLRKHK